MFTQIGSWFVDPIFFALPLFHKHLFNPFRWVSKNWFQYFNCLWQWKCGNTSALNMWIKILISIRLQYLFFKLEKFSDPVLWIFCNVINLYLIPKFICLCFLLTCPSTACTFMNEFTKFNFYFIFWSLLCLFTIHLRFSICIGWFFHISRLDGGRWLPPLVIY